MGNTECTKQINFLFGLMYIYDVESGDRSVFSSPELKAQVSFSDHPLSGVRLSVRL
jgi:hypothetical protein